MADLPERVAAAGWVDGAECGRHPGQFTRAREPEASTFLRHLAEGGTVTGGAKVSRTSWTTLYAWRDSDPAFAEAWERAYTAGTEFYEEEAKRRAILGTEEPVWYQGKQVGTVRKPSDRLMELMLKARAPDKYRERVDVRHSAEPMSSEELAKARAAGMAPEVEAAAALLASVPVVVEGTASDAG